MGALIRVITIRHSSMRSGLAVPAAVEACAGLAHDAGIGATAHMWAQAASLRSRSGWSPAAMRGAGRRCRGRRRRGRAGRVCGWYQRTIRSSAARSRSSRNSTRRPSSRSAMRTEYSAASPGRGRSAATASKSGRAEPGEPGAQLVRAGQDQRPGLVNRLGLRSWRALRLATISARIASTAPSRPLGSPWPARTRRRGGADRVLQRV